MKITARMVELAALIAAYRVQGCTWHECDVFIFGEGTEKRTRIMWNRWAKKVHAE